MSRGEDDNPFDLPDLPEHWMDVIPPELSGLPPDPFDAPDPPAHWTEPSLSGPAPAPATSYSIFRGHYDSLFDRPISETVEHFSRLDPELYRTEPIPVVVAPGARANRETRPVLYHWTCSEATPLIADVGERAKPGARGALEGLLVRRRQGISTVAQSTRDLYEDVSAAGLSNPALYPVGKQRETIQDIAVYWFVFKNIATYFSRHESGPRGFEVLVRDNCEEAKLSGNVSLWKLAGDPANYLVVDDPEARHGIAVIPRRNNGLVPVRLVSIGDPEDY